MATTTLGGKAGGPSTPGLFLQPRESLLEEALAPLRDDLARRVEASGDLVVGQSLRGVEDDLGAYDVRSEEHTSELQSLAYLVCRLLLEKKKMYRVLADPMSWQTARTGYEGPCVGAVKCDVFAEVRSIRS